MMIPDTTYAALSTIRTYAAQMPDRELVVRFTSPDGELEYGLAVRADGADRFEGRAYPSGWRAMQQTWQAQPEWLVARACTAIEREAGYITRPRVAYVEIDPCSAGA